MVKLKGRLIRITDTEAIKELIDPAVQNSGYNILRVHIWTVLIIRYKL